MLVMISLFYFLWTQLDLNQRPPDYESGATNRLSYGSSHFPEKNVSLQSDDKNNKFCYSKKIIFILLNNGII